MIQTYSEAESGRPNDYQEPVTGVWRKFRNKPIETIELADGGRIETSKVDTKLGLWAWNQAGFEYKQYDRDGNLVKQEYIGQSGKDGNNYHGKAEWAVEEFDAQVEQAKADVQTKFSEQYGEQYENIQEYEQRITDLQASYDADTAEKIALGQITEAEAKRGDEIEAEEKKEELEIALDRARKSAEQQTEDVTAQYVETQQTNVARAAGREMMNTKNQLAAQGYSPEEIRQITESGVANIGRMATDTTAAAQGAKAQALAQIFQAERSDTTTVADYGRQVSNFADTLRQNQKISQAQINAQLYGVDQNVALSKWNTQQNIQLQRDLAPDPWADAIAGLTEAGGEMATAYIATSDSRLKENIDLVGKSLSGVNIYEFEYKDKSYGSGRYRGVMAQEIPEASFRNADGYLWVDYSKGDVDFEEIEEN